MSSKRLDTINDFVRHRLDCRIVCPKCNRAVIISALDLQARLVRSKRSMAVRDVERRLKCAWCDHRGARLEPSGLL
jgi:hypothetical protein